MADRSQVTNPVMVDDKHVIGSIDPRYFDKAIFAELAKCIWITSFSTHLDGLNVEYRVIYPVEHHEEIIAMTRKYYVSN